MTIQLATNFQSVEQQIDTVQKRTELNTEDVDAFAMEFVSTDLHLIPLPQLQMALDTNLQTGLTALERQQRLIKNGPNKLSEGKGQNIFIKIIKTQADFFAILLWAASLVTFIMYFVTKEQNNLWLAIVLAIVNIFSGFLNFFQEFKSSNIMKSFKSMIPQECLVFEDSIIKKVQTEQLVVGDLVKVQQGMKCPADIRIIQLNQLKIDMSSFNGETEPASRSIENEERNILRSQNIVYFTSNVLQGDGLGVVIFTGDNTVIGSQALSVTSQRSVPTPIQREIGFFVKVISVFAVCLGILFMVIAILVKMAPLDAFIFCVGIIIACVPEGLSITITVALALSAKKLAKKNVLAKELKSVETLGSVSVVCSDKTGTLTLNQMTISHSFAFDAIAKHEIDFSEGQFVVGSGVGEELVRVLALNSRCEVDQTDQNRNFLTGRLMGDASEAGITRFCNSLISQRYTQFADARFPILKFRESFPKIFEIPFSSVHKFQYSVHQTPDSEALMTIKGAPERIVEMCEYVLIGQQIVRLTSEHKTKIYGAYSTIAGFGERVIGCAYKIEKLRQNYDVEIKDIGGIQFILLGLISLIDPPKDGVAQAIQQCRIASIQVTMITGDHHLTAASIAKTIGILSEEIDYYTEKQTIDEISRINSDEESIRFSLSVERQSIERSSLDLQRMNTSRLEARALVKKQFKKQSIEDHSISEMQAMPPLLKSFIPQNHSLGAVMTGNVLEVLTPTQLKYFLNAYKEVVFARTTPEQKLSITKAYQTLGKVTAVSGDGMNDAPALKAADIGVAMVAGSEVAREAADIVLMDNSFATIVDGIQEGRLIYENIKKAMQYTVVSCVPQVFPFVLFIIMGFPNAMSAIQILLLDFVTDIWPAFALAYELPESDLMTRRPRKSEKMLTGRLAAFAYGQIGCFMALAVITVFMLTVRAEAQRYFPCADVRGSAFVSFQHEDFQRVALPQALELAQKSCTQATPFPTGVTTVQELAAHIYLAAQSAAFLSVVVNQFAHALISRTRLNSIFQQGVFSNPVLLAGLLAQLVVASVVIYVPFCNTALGSRPIGWFSWAVCAPFAVFMLVYDELRKLALRRKGPDSLFFRLMYW
ncbi:Sodium/potassium-transporting ATPase alpha chain [Spironucleus salmonicida]|uniref:Potassium-transporting ATPase alpha chain 1 n=1 Tax=Spironucleus salmonicida TaxID=348837 RepID=V6LMK9_9EUKA|nr:Sodium/potassium-transporting ATPase alpha chain [Spironucleus salmonicida]|eukprot:EST45875.1 Potassium-transporting ATPase alpha chain 1 [Spironucleus salmonicida]